MKPLIAGNWKMYKTRAEGADLARQIGRGLSGALSGADVVLFPPYTCLSSVVEAVADTPIGVGAQNLHPKDEGAFTGEISPRMLLDVGATWVLVGHSERRHGLGEKDDFLNAKVHAALRHDLLPILCVGETLEERDAGRTVPVIEQQVRACLQGVPAARAGDLTLAYEPVWAIGTGRNATPAQAGEVHARIRGLLATLFGEEGRRIRILYGGSVKADNASALMKTPEVNGALVGGASLQAEGFLSIVRAACA